MNHFILIISFSLKTQPLFNRILVRDCHIEAREAEKCLNKKVTHAKYENQNTEIHDGNRIADAVGGKVERAFN